MRLKSIVITSAMALALLSGCHAKTRLPLMAEDVRICNDTAEVVSFVKRISDNQNLSFHYSTYKIDYGTQVTFLLIGDGYEIVLLNTFSQDEYTLRVYQMKDGDAHRIEVEKAYQRFKQALGHQIKC
jgi:hypothetical protein